MLINERLGLRRDEMPQLDHEECLAFLDWLKADGVSVRPEAIDPAALGRTQKAINGQKVQGMVRAHRLGKFPGLTDQRIVISSDNYVLDGHHRWAALRQLGSPMKVWRVDMPIDKLVGLALQYLALNEVGT